MKVTPCEDCPCCNCSREECECNLGYNMELFFTISNGLIYASKNCGLELVRYNGGEFVKPEAIDVKYKAKGTVEIRKKPRQPVRADINKSDMKGY